jgi:hypothetical protein
MNRYQPTFSADRHTQCYRCPLIGLERETSGRKRDSMASLLSIECKERAKYTHYLGMLYIWTSLRLLRYAACF